MKTKSIFILGSTFTFLFLFQWAIEYFSNPIQKIPRKFPGPFMNTSGPTGRSAAPSGGGLTDKFIDKFTDKFIDKFIEYNFIPTLKKSLY